MEHEKAPHHYTYCAHPFRTLISTHTISRRRPCLTAVLTLCSPLEVTSILSVILKSMDQVSILSSGFSALSYFCENGETSRLPHALAARETGGDAKIETSVSPGWRSDCWKASGWVGSFFHGTP